MKTYLTVDLGKALSIIMQKIQVLTKQATSPGTITPLGLVSKIYLLVRPTSILRVGIS